MHAAEASVAHHKDAVAGSRIGCRFLYEKIQIRVGVCLVAERCERFRLCLLYTSPSPRDA